VEEPSLLGHSNIQFSMCVEIIQKYFLGLTMREIREILLYFNHAHDETWKCMDTHGETKQNYSRFNSHMVRPKQYSGIYLNFALFG
jgi:hypothetical protein